MASELDVPLVRYDGPRIDLVHPTAAGYQLLAEEILAQLRSEGYVQ